MVGDAFDATPLPGVGFLSPSLSRPRVHVRRRDQSGRSTRRRCPGRQCGDRRGHRVPATRHRRRADLRRALRRSPRHRLARPKCCGIRHAGAQRTRPAPTPVWGCGRGRRALRDLARRRARRPHARNPRPARLAAMDRRAAGKPAGGGRRGARRARHAGRPTRGLLPPFARRAVRLGVVFPSNVVGRGRRPGRRRSRRTAGRSGCAATRRWRP